MTPKWELTVPPTPAAKSAPGNPNCAWLKRLKNSARKSRPMRSVNRKRLINEKSVFTKFGPETGAREAFPRPPTIPEAVPAGTKQLVLNHFLMVCGPDLGSQI